MKYSASLDTMAKVITVFVFLIVGFISYKGYLMIQETHDRTITIMQGGIISLLAGTLILAYLLAPDHYEVRNGEFVIHRHLKNKIIPIQEIQEVRIAGQEEMKNMIRTFGVGGLFGYFGKYYTSSLKSISLFATQRKNYILIVRKDQKKIVVTPDDPSLADALSALINK